MKNYHFCRSSHDEVMYRSEADLIIGFNYLVYAALETDSKLLADGFLSTHHHCITRTDSPELLIKRHRYAYTRYFNAKYHRRGSLGEKRYFLLELDGLYHTQTAFSYVLRQGLHHGLTATPFEYKHCSVNSYFRKELGKTDNTTIIDNEKRHQFLPRNVIIPTEYRMDKNGLLLREDVIDTSYVESVYVSPRNFLYQMNRITDEKIIKEQQDENSLPPITISSIEKGVPDFNPQKVFIQEAGRVNHNLMTDIELCHIIDDIILPRRFFKNEQEASIYLLSKEKRASIGASIWEECHNRNPRNSLFSGKIVTESQLKRCLVI